MVSFSVLGVYARGRHIGKLYFMLTPFSMVLLLHQHKRLKERDRESLSGVEAPALDASIRFRL